MPLNVDVGTLTQPGATGNADITLSANFDPKAIILWATPQTADAYANTTASFGFGFGTYRGSAVQQGYSALFSLNGAGSADTARGSNTDALLKLYSASTPTVDLEIDLVSMTTGSGSKVTVNWVNLHTTASIRVHYMILGGSDLTDAYVHSYALSTASATQDVTVVAGFGQPDLMLFSGSGVTTLGDAASHWQLFFGAAKSATERYAVALQNQDGAGTITMGGIHKARAIVGVGVTPVVDYEADLSAKASWPTDGYQLSFSDQASLAQRVIGLSLKGTFTATVGSFNSSTSTNGTVDFNHGSTPTGALVFNAVGPGTATTLDTSSSYLGGFGLGGYDGSSEAYAGACDDDGDNAADTGVTNSTAKVAQFFLENAGIVSEADGSFSGNNFRTTWTLADPIAEQFGVVTFGSQVVAAFMPTPIRPVSQAVTRKAFW